jgi:hypothetical protein
VIVRLDRGDAGTSVAEGNGRTGKSPAVPGITVQIREAGFVIGTEDPYLPFKGMNNNPHPHISFREGRRPSRYCCPTDPVAEKHDRCVPRVHPVTLK